MAKGRKLTASRSEYMLGSYSNGRGYGPELSEDDVWSAVNEVAAEDDDGEEDGVGNYRRGSMESIDMRGRNIPRGDHRRGDAGGLSLAFEDQQSRRRIVHQFRGGGGGDESPCRRHQQEQRHGMATSAPVNVPNWSKIYRVGSTESMHGSDDDDRDSEMVPPHEYLAREYARSRNSAADSVFEGVGRTLKGRDMRRVRDAVWSQTGFDG